MCKNAGFVNGQYFIEIADSFKTDYWKENDVIYVNSYWCECTGDRNTLVHQAIFYFEEIENGFTKEVAQKRADFLTARWGLTNHIKGEYLEDIVDDIILDDPILEDLIKMTDKKIIKRIHNIHGYYV